MHGSGLSNEVTGKTIKQITIRGKRDGGAGDKNEAPIDFRVHTHTSLPSGSPNIKTTYHHRVKIKREQSFEVTLPSYFGF